MLVTLTDGGGTAGTSNMEKRTHNKDLNSHLVLKSTFYGFCMTFMWP